MGADSCPRFTERLWARDSRRRDAALGPPHLPAIHTRVSTEQTGSRAAPHPADAWSYWKQSSTQPAPGDPLRRRRGGGLRDPPRGAGGLTSPPCPHPAPGPSHALKITPRGRRTTFFRIGTLLASCSLAEERFKNTEPCVLASGSQKRSPAAAPPGGAGPGARRGQQAGAARAAWRPFPLAPPRARLRPRWGLPRPTHLLADFAGAAVSFSNSSCSENITTLSVGTGEGRGGVSVRPPRRGRARPALSPPPPGRPAQGLPPTWDLFLLLLLAHGGFRALHGGAGAAGCGGQRAWAAGSRRGGERWGGRGRHLGREAWPSGCRT